MHLDVCRLAAACNLGATIPIYTGLGCDRQVMPYKASLVAASQQYQTPKHNLTQRRYIDTLAAYLNKAVVKKQTQSRRHCDERLAELCRHCLTHNGFNVWTTRAIEIFY